jgi:YVTN family beta-propeller protein
MSSDHDMVRTRTFDDARRKAFSLFAVLLALIATTGCGGGSTSAANNGGSGGQVAATVRASVMVDTNPTGVAVNPSTNSVYVVNHPGTFGGLSRIDGTTDSNTGESFPFNQLEEANNLNCVAYKINCEIVSEPVAIAVDSLTNTGYTFLAGVYDFVDKSTQTFSYVVATDMATSGYPISSYFVVGETTSCGPVLGIQAPAPGYHIVGVNTATHKVYAAWPLCNEVEVFDFTAPSVSTLANPGYPIALAVNPTTNKVYVANLDGNNVTVIDGATNSVVTTIIDPNALGPIAVAINPTTNTIYVANSQSNNLTVIDGTTDSVRATISVGTSPLGVDVDPQTNFIYVANGGNVQTGDPGNVTVINGATNVTDTLTDANAKNPVAVAVNQTINRIYVANSGSNNVTVIDGAR